MGVAVLSPTGQPLMPTKPSRARRWLKEGKAAVKVLEFYLPVVQQQKHWVTGVTEQGIVKSSPVVSEAGRSPRSDLTAYLPKFRFAAFGVSREKR